MRRRAKRPCFASELRLSTPFPSCSSCLGHTGKQPNKQYHTKEQSFHTASILTFIWLELKINSKPDLTYRRSTSCVNRTSSCYAAKKLASVSGFLCGSLGRLYRWLWGKVSPRALRFASSPAPVASSSGGALLSQVSDPAVSVKPADSAAEWRVEILAFGRQEQARCGHGSLVQSPHNNSFNPNPLRSTNNMADKACHVVGSTTQVGLTQAIFGSRGLFQRRVACRSRIASRRSRAVGGVAPTYGIG